MSKRSIHKTVSRSVFLILFCFLLGACEQSQDNTSAKFCENLFYLLNKQDNDSISLFCKKYFLDEADISKNLEFYKNAGKLKNFVLLEKSKEFLVSSSEKYKIDVLKFENIYDSITTIEIFRMKIDEGGDYKIVNTFIYDSVEVQ